VSEAGLRIRPPEPSDLPELTALYNHYVASSPVTFDVEPFAIEQRRAWFEHYAPAGRHRLLVADADGRVVGYATSGLFRVKQAYDPSVETTVYVAQGLTRQGIGDRLYRALFDALAQEGVHRAYAGITLPNPATLALHRRFGFQSVGVYDEVGRKFGRYWSVEWLEKKLR
jgi:phosphinothricin acetyltransferase